MKMKHFGIFLSIWRKKSEKISGKKYCGHEFQTIFWKTAKLRIFHFAGKYTFCLFFETQGWGKIIFGVFSKKKKKTNPKYLPEQRINFETSELNWARHFF